MKKLPFTWDEVVAELKKGIGATPQDLTPLKGWFERECIVARAYEKHEVIARQGDPREHVGVILKGGVQVYPKRPRMVDAPPPGDQGPPPGDLDSPRSRGTVSSDKGAINLDSQQRLVGLTSVMWNLTHSVTLAAGAEGCHLLLVKRFLLRQLQTNCPALRPWNHKQFWERKLPGWLAGNRLFEGGRPAPARLREFLDREAGAAAPGHSPVQLLHFDRGTGKSCLVNYVPGKSPLPPANGAAFTVFQDKQPADGLYFVLVGTVRLTRALPGGSAIVNQLGAGTFFGPGCIDRSKGEATLTAEAVADGVLLRLSDAAARRLCATFPGVADELGREEQRRARRDKEVQAAEHLPPAGMSQETAAKLLLATDLLVIDMDLCTRCDECVAGCVNGHEGIARFHRANPKMRFDRWEVARACAHCGDAPCQAACPAGAITFLADGVVQIHHARCTGCMQCVPVCPFDVIVMRPPDDLAAWPQLKDPEHGHAIKCDRCLTKHKEPACVAGCPYGAAKRGKPDELVPGLRAWAEGR
jgi:Fe-S-cluster-containing hydrogenase component 2/CRP-like cAMP-binding protein